MVTLNQYQVVHADENMVIFKDLGKSGYEPPVCYDRRTGKFSDMTNEVFDLGGYDIEILQ